MRSRMARLLWGPRVLSDAEVEARLYPQLADTYERMCRQYPSVYAMDDEDRVFWPLSVGTFRQAHDAQQRQGRKAA